MSTRLNIEPTQEQRTARAECRKKWNATEKGKASRAAALKKYLTSKKGQARRARYWQGYKKKLETDPHLQDARRKSYTKKVLKKSYAITIEERATLLALQKHRCGICSHPIECGYGPGRNCAYIDHDHQTKEIRGLLCLGCNTGLGNFKDSLWRLKAAQQYLLDHSNPKKGTGL